MNLSILFVIVSLCAHPIGTMMEKNKPFDSESEFVQEGNDFDVEQMTKSSNNSSFENPDYTLGSSNKSLYFPYDLKRDFSYANLDLLNKIQVGDLIYERDQIGGIGHIGIVEKSLYKARAVILFAP